MSDPINVNGYDPYTQGWYLLPVTVSQVPLSVNASGVKVSKISGLTVDQVEELNSHTIQGLIELVYVRVANDYLYQGLNGLDVALDKTSRTLDLLSALQEFHNAVSVSSMGSLSAWFIYNANYKSTSNYQDAYQNAASAFFGLPVFPDFLFANASAVVQIGGKSTSFSSFANDLFNLKQQLRSDLMELDSIDPTAKDNANSLYSTTKQVLCDLPPDVDGKITWTDAKLWALDYYTVDDGKDYAQGQNNYSVILTVSTAFPNWIISLGREGDNYYYSAVSFSRARLPGMGEGMFCDDQSKVLNDTNYTSFRVAPGSFDFAKSEGGTGNSSDPPADFDYFVEYPPGIPGIDHYMPAGQRIRTFLMTFSGRLGFETYEEDGDVNVRVIPVNPMDDDGNVRNTISGYTGSAAERGGQGEKAGQFQQNITVAITSAQGLNNTQTETIRSFLFTFEEYYKSATSVLSSISSLISKFGQNIRPS